MTRPLHVLWLVAALAVGCDDRNPSAAFHPNEVPQTGPKEPVIVTGEKTTPAPAPDAAVAPVKLDDAQILHVLATANAADIEAGKLAKTKSQNPAITGFAEQMIRDHGTADERARKLAETKGLTPADNETSQKLKQAHDTALAQLRNLEGAAFEKAYIDHEVDMHQELLELIDRSIVPGAQDADLKSLVAVQLRPSIAAHLDLAKRIQSDLTAPATH